MSDFTPTDVTFVIDHDIPTKGDVVNAATGAVDRLVKNIPLERLLVFAKVLSEYAKTFDTEVRRHELPVDAPLATGKVSRVLVQPEPHIEGDGELDRLAAELAVAEDTAKLLKDQIKRRRAAIINAHECGLPTPEGVKIRVPELTPQYRVKL